jgi:hypothetical protein
MKRVMQILATMVLLVVAAGIAVPHFAADRFGARIQDALQSSLGRKVKIGAVRFNLFTGPGFTIEDVEVQDDPALSAEPILYAKYLTAVPQLLPLIAGKMAFYSIRLDDARINLGRTASPDQPARWNVDALTRASFFETFPNITVNSGRINFKIGGVKTVFYIITDKFEIHPPSAAGSSWTLYLEGEPARTDRPARGFGSFIADAHWYPAKGSADMNVKLERSEVGDIVALLNGYDLGVHGSVSGQARFAGPLAALAINGRVEVRGIHGWDQMPSAAQNWPLAIAGTWNVPGQTFELNARLAGQPNSPVNARFRVADYLGAPHWGLTLACRAMPLQPLLPLARQIGLPISGGVQLNGTLDGAVSFARTGPVEGSAMISKAELAAAGAPPLTFSDTHMTVAGGRVVLGPSTLRAAGDEEATLGAEFDLTSRALSITVASKGMELSALRNHPVLSTIPVLRELQTGVWKGSLTYSNETDSPAVWSGAIDLQRAVISFPPFAGPIRIATAHVDLNEDGVSVRRLQARSGDLAVSGEYRYLLQAPHPHRFHLIFNRATGGQLEALLRPALNRGGLVSRALNLGRSTMPDWLAQIDGDGTLEFGSLVIHDIEFDAVKSRLLWLGPRVKLTAMQARAMGGGVSGLIDIDLSGSSPAYHLAGHLTGIPWKGGKVEAGAAVDTSGTGAQALLNLRAEGDFKARNVDLDYPAISGCYQLSWNSRQPQIKLTSLVLSDGDESYVGSASTAPNGDLIVSLTGSGMAENPKPVRLSLR